MSTRRAFRNAVLVSKVVSWLATNLVCAHVQLSLPVCLLMAMMLAHVTNHRSQSHPYYMTVFPTPYALPCAFAI